MTEDKKRPSGYDVTLYTKENEKYGYRYCHCGKMFSPGRTYVFRVDGYDDENDSDYGNFECLDCAINSVKMDIYLLKQSLAEIRTAKNTEDDEEGEDDD